MTRRFWVLAHRYAGLYMAFFLTVAGLTGSVLAFYHELDHWLNPPEDWVIVQAATMLSPVDLREQALALEPHARINSINLQQEPGEIYIPEYQPRVDSETNTATLRFKLLLIKVLHMLRALES